MKGRGSLGFVVRTGVLIVVGLRVVMIPLIVREIVIVSSTSDGRVSQAALRLEGGAWALNVVLWVWTASFHLTGLAWIYWQYQRHDWLDGPASVSGMPMHPVTGVVLWFVPFASLVGPAIVTSSIVRGMRAGPGRGVRDGAFSPVVVWWWLVFVVAWVALTWGQIFHAFEGLVRIDPAVTSSDIVGMAALSDLLLLVGALLLLVAAPLALWIIKTIERGRASMPPVLQARPDIVPVVLLPAPPSDRPHASGTSLTP